MQLRTHRRLQETVQPLYINLFAALSNLSQGEATRPFALLACKVPNTTVALSSWQPSKSCPLLAMFIGMQYPFQHDCAGLKFLVDLRGDMLAAIKAAPEGAASVRLLADSLRWGG